MPKGNISLNLFFYYFITSELFQISSEVKNTFLQIYNNLKERETQLLRQVEVFVQHCSLNNSYDKCFKQISVVFDNELDILLSISKFGRINLNGISQESNIYKIEEYQQPTKDHDELHINVSNELDDTTKEKIEIESNETYLPTENIDRPISNVILECIEKQDPRLCQHENKKQELLSCCSSSNEENTIRKYCDTINRLEENVNNLVSSRRGMQQPVQVQLWMDQIIREPETEPQPTNVMEHSQIKP